MAVTTVAKNVRRDPPRKPVRLRPLSLEELRLTALADLRLLFARRSTHE